MPDIFSNQAFIIILTAVVSGLLAPSLLKFLENRLGRSTEIERGVRDNQVRLATELTKTVWRWRFLAKQICYYGMHHKKSDAHRLRFEKAVADYEKEVWGLFTDIKAFKTESLIWFPGDAAKTIEELYTYIKGKVDSPVTKLVEEVNEGNDRQQELKKWSEDFTDTVSDNIDAKIALIAALIKK